MCIAATDRSSNRAAMLALAGQLILNIGVDHL
jgi:hypothetical protein